MPETCGAYMTNETPPSAQTMTPAQTINIQAPAASPTNGLAVASLVLGIIALFTFWIPVLGWIPVLLGFVLGLIGLSQSYGRGMAIAGVVCSGIALAIKLIFWVALIGLFGAAATSAAASHV